MSEPDYTWADELSLRDLLTEIVENYEPGLVAYECAIRAMALLDSQVCEGQKVVMKINDVEYIAREDDGALRITSMGTFMVVEPQAANSIRIRSAK